MTIQEAKEILTLYRPDTADANDPEFAEALALARRDAELGRWFEGHCAVQSALRARFRQIAVPAGLKEQIISERKAGSLVVWLRRPVVLAAAAALAIMVGIAALWPSHDGNDDEQRTFATYRSRMVSAVLRNYAMSLETADEKQIRAHLAQKKAPNDYVLPEPLGKTPLAGCGALSWQTKDDVTMICFLSGRPLAPGVKSDLFLFVVDRDAFPDAPATTGPTFARVKKLVTASWSAGGKTYILASAGDEAFIRRYF